MDIEKILQELTARFAAPLPEFHKRRLIFWRDEEREFADQLMEIQLKLPVKFAQLNGLNNFEIKKLLEYDDPESSYLIYDPVDYLRLDDDWLLNLRLLSEEFRSDLIAVWMDEMKLENTAALRQIVKEYRKFFNAKDRREKFAAISKHISDPEKISRAILAVLCGINSIIPKDILRSVLSQGVDQDQNAIYQRFQSYSLEGFFWQRMSGIGYYAEQPNLKDFARYLILTATAKTLPAEYLIGLEDYYSPHSQYQSSCYDILSDWLHDSNTRSFMREIICDVERELHMANRIAAIPLDDLMQTEYLPCIDEGILMHLMRDICENSILPDDAKNIVEKRRTMVWHDLSAEYFEGVWQCAEMQLFYRDHSHGFHTVDPQQLWQEYTKEYFRMDTYYRKFHLAFGNALKHPNPVLDDAYKSVAEAIEALYSNWFLKELNTSWATACGDTLEKSGQIPGIKQQQNFYNDRIASAGNKIYVVISDGLRYEVAAQVAEDLHRNTQSKVSLENCQSIFPTATKFGMAALLPHNSLSAVKSASGVAILADGESTDSPNRENILQKKNLNSAALQLSKLKAMKRAERLDLVRGKEVVYIYTDSIDSAGHNSPTEVFSACEQAIDDIKEAVRMIVNDFCAHYIYITSDHGFLYTYRSLQEEEKVGKGVSSDDAVEVDSRYLITANNATPEFLMPVKFMQGNSEFSAFATRENVRIKKQGGYTNYIHGGISLQEMVVPVIDYHFMRSSSKDYKAHPEKYDTLPAPLQLVSSNRKITNMMFALSFYQKDPVGTNREAATYALYFTDSDGNKISDEQKIIADRTSQTEQDRIFRCTFNLKSLEYHRTENYYLVIAEQSGVVPPLREIFQIDIAFAVDSFDFFRE